MMLEPQQKPANAASLHERFMDAALTLLDSAITADPDNPEDPKVFNLLVYMEMLKANFYSKLQDKSIRDLVLDADEIASWYWAQIAIAETGTAWPKRFRGMEVLD